METIEFMRQRKRMCDYYGDDTCVCYDSRGVCPALYIDCSFSTDSPEHLIKIVEKWAKEHPEESEHEQQEEAKNEQSNNTLADHVYHLEDCVREMNERLTIFIHDTVDKIHEIEEHAAHQDRAIMCDRVHVGDTAEEEQPKKRTRMEVFLELFPNALMRTDVHVPVVRPCETDVQYRSRDCTHVNCYECMEKYWNEEVDG